MSNSLSIRIPDEIDSSLKKLCKDLERPKTFIIIKAIENYLREYADYQIALDRFNDKDDEIVSSKEMRKNLGL